MLDGSASHTGDTADVLCSDGAVRTVAGDGKVTTAYQRAGLIAIGMTGDNTLVVARTVSGCDGVEMDKVSDGSAHRITCVKGASTAVDLTPLPATTAGWSPHTTPGRAGRAGVGQRAEPVAALAVARPLDVYGVVNIHVDC